MFRPSRVVSKMVSTRGGMRRSLKRLPRVQDYLRQAVEAGTYRTPDEIERLLKQRAENSDDLKTVMRRFRQDIVRGSAVHDYPPEYLILQQHPPLPFKPRTPRRIIQKLAHQRRRNQQRLQKEAAAMQGNGDPPQPQPKSVETLVQEYLHRQEQKGRPAALDNDDDDDDESRPPLTADEYYRRLLGVPHHRTTTNSPSSSSSLMRHKSAAVQQAYAAAVHHYSLVRRDGLSDSEAMRQVDDILEQARQRQAEQSAAHQRAVTHFRQAHTAHAGQTVREMAKDLEDETGRPWRRSVEQFARQAKQAQSEEPNDDDSNNDDDDSTSSSSFFALSRLVAHDPSTVEAVMRWGERLQAVPYRQWTVGASTSLDHWLAGRILAWPEETWQAVLEGRADDQLVLVQELQTVRHALFPETTWGMEESTGEEEDEEWNAGENEEEEEDEDDEEEISIDKLLATLGDLTPSASSNQNDVLAMDDSAVTDTDVDDDNNADDEEAAQLTRLVEELQDWRRLNVEAPYDSWTATKQDDFNDWLKTYVAQVLLAGSSILTAHHQQVDYEATRHALLDSSPPVDQAAAQEFWTALQSPGTASALLDRMRQEGPPTAAQPWFQPSSQFWQLDYDQQLERLLNLGVLQPLLDEYATDSARLQFLQQYADLLLAGVPLEHLVEVSDDEGDEEAYSYYNDDSGSTRRKQTNPLVEVSDVSGTLARQLRLKEGKQYRLHKQPYRGTPPQPRQPSSGKRDSALEKSRALFQAWNDHKANRARYEERLFQTDRLGLTYGDSEDDDEKEDDAVATSTKNRTSTS